MKPIIVMVTHNRLAYSKRTLDSLFATIEVPYYLIVVDNASTDGTKKFLTGPNGIDEVILNPKNYYPGKATNIGWARGIKRYPEATHLIRLDNDMEFVKGWDARATEYFEKIDRLGQLGLDFDGGENKVPEYYNGMGLVEWPGCVGGPSIIRREVYDAGHRYDESVWDGSRSRLQEDARFSRKLKEDGWLVGHMDTRMSYTFANRDNWKDYPEYYLKTMYDRGYDDNVEFIKKEMK